MLKAKICGITNAFDANLAIQFGAWAIGFNFYKGSPRYVSFDKAKQIKSAFLKEVITVGILINYSEEDIIKALDLVDFIQVYEAKPCLNAYTNRTILSLHSNSDEACLNDKKLQDYAYILLDAPYQHGAPLGGTGQCADWSLAKKLAQKTKLILAGGLTSDNVALAISEVNPFAVDVASGVEEKPGIKSESKLKELLKRCKYE